MQQKNFLVFIVLSVLILLSWSALSKYILPQPKKPDPQEVAVNEDNDKPKADTKEPGDKKKPDDKKNGKKPEDKKGDKKPDRAAAVSIPSLPRTPRDKLINLGTDESGSKFHLKVVLDPRGASVESVRSATMPCELGGSSYTVTSRYRTESGSTQSARCAARSSHASRPPMAWTDRTTSPAIAPR